MLYATPTRQQTYPHAVGVLCLQQSIVAIPRGPKCIIFLCVIAASLYCCRRPFILFSFIDLSVGRPRARYPFPFFFFFCVCGYLVFPATHLKRSPLSDHCGAAVVSDDWRSLRSSLCVRAQYSESQILGRSSINLFVVRFVSPLSLSQAAVSHVRNAPETAAASGAKANPGAAWCVACLGWRFYLMWTQQSGFGGTEDTYEIPSDRSLAEEMAGPKRR